MQATGNGKPRLSWFGKFYVAFRGIYWGISGQPSFIVHFIAAFAALGLAWYFRFDAIRWMIVLLCIGLVLVAELINSAIEMLFRGLPETVQSRCWPALDVAAGSVLLASLFALIVGCLLFLPEIVRLFV